MKTKNNADKMRELVWVVAGRPENNLDWVMQIRDQFEIGSLKRSDKGYFVSVKDVVGERTTEVYIPEADLRHSELTDEIESANRSYNLDKKIEDSRKERKRERRSEIIKRVVGTVIGTGLVAAGAWTFDGYRNSPSKVRSRELEQKTQIILPGKEDLSERTIATEPLRYTLEDGTEVSTFIYHEENSFRFCIDESGKTRYISEWWLAGTDPRGGSEGDARFLDVLEYKTENGWTSFPREEIKDYARKQKEYESLIEKIAKIKSQKK